MRIAPCKGCPRREVGCHGKCQDYIGWKAEYDEEQKIQKGKRRADQQLIDDRLRFNRKYRHK